MKVIKLLAVAAALALIVVVALGVFVMNGSDTTISALQPKTLGLTQYHQLTDGMTYDDAVRVLGSPGQEMSRNTIGEIVTVMYMWEGTGAIGANMNAMFQNGRLISKAQFNLR